MLTWDVVTTVKLFFHLNEKKKKTSKSALSFCTAFSFQQISNGTSSKKRCPGSCESYDCCLLWHLDLILCHPEVIVSVLLFLRVRSCRGVCSLAYVVSYTSCMCVKVLLLFSIHDCVSQVCGHTCHAASAGTSFSIMCELLNTGSR